MTTHLRPLPAQPARGRLALAAWGEPRPDRLMRVIGVIVFAYVWRIQDIFPFLGKLQLPLLSLAGALALYVASSHPSRRLGQLRGPILAITLGLLAVMLAGIPTSLWPGHSITFAVKIYMTTIVFMVLVAASARTVRDVEWYASLNLYGALFYAIVVNVFFRVGSDGRLGNLVYYDANDYALVTVASIPFAVYFMRSGNKTSRRVVGLIALGLFVLGVVKSGSRGGFIAMVAVLLYMLLRYRAIPSRLRLFAAVAGVGFMAMLASDHYWDQMRTILHPQEDYNWTDPSGRREVWKRGLGYVAARPILGVGVGAFPVAEGTLSEIAREYAARGRGFKWSVAHNSFLEVAAELGVPGFLLFVSLFLVSIRMMMRVRAGPRYGPWITSRETALAQVLVMSLVGFAAAAVFVSAEYFSYLYFLLGMVIALDKVLRLRRDTAFAAPAPARPMRMAASPALARAAMLPRRP